MTVGSAGVRRRRVTSQVDKGARHSLSCRSSALRRTHLSELPAKCLCCRLHQLDPVLYAASAINTRPGSNRWIRRSAGVGCKQATKHLICLTAAYFLLFFAFPHPIPLPCRYASPRTESRTGSALQRNRLRSECAHPGRSPGSYRIHYRPLPRLSGAAVLHRFDGSVHGIAVMEVIRTLQGRR
jgi:hypothetical protein